MNIALKKAAVAATTVACFSLISVSGSDWNFSFGVERAYAQTDRAASRRPSHAVDSTHHRYRRAAPRNTRALVAEAVASTTSYWDYDDYYCSGDPNAYRGYPPGSYYYRAYSGGHCVPANFVTGRYGRTTLFPRYYGGWIQ
jgi:hypothetical protein